MTKEIHQVAEQVDFTGYNNDLFAYLGKRANEKREESKKKISDFAVREEIVCGIVERITEAEENIDDIQTALSEWADNQVDIYDHTLLHSVPYFANAIDDANKEYGHPESSLIEMIMRGQYYVYNALAHEVWSILEQDNN